MVVVEELEVTRTDGPDSSGGGYSVTAARAVRGRGVVVFFVIQPKTCESPVPSASRSTGRRTTSRRVRRGGGYLTYGLLLSNLDQGLDLTAQIYRCDPGNEETPSATKGNLFIIPVGDGPTDRTGNRVVIKMLYIHGTITWPLVAQATADPYSKLNDTRVHILVVADSQTNGAGCTLDDIFDNCASQTGGTAYESFQFGNMLQRNLVKSTRFKILFHKTYSKHNTQTTGGFSSTYPAGSPPANGNVGQMPCSQTFKLSKKLTLPVTYNYGTTGAITEIMDNSLHLFAWHSGGDTGYQATGCSPYLSYSVRTRFFG